MNDETTRLAPAYLPFRTFLNSIDALQNAVPKRIDRKIWRTSSGAVQSQIVIAFRFLGLVDDEDKPTPLLHRLVAAEGEEQKKAIKKLVEKSYKDIIAHDLTKMTPTLLEDEMGKFGISGGTRRKAVTFFLQAAKHVDLQLSPYLLSQVRNTSRTRRKRNPRITRETSLSSRPQVEKGNSRVVHLRSGGSLTLVISADIWAMPLNDRDFVLSLIDKVQQYEKPQKQKEKN